MRGAEREGGSPWSRAATLARWLGPRSPSSVAGRRGGGRDTPCRRVVAGGRREHFSLRAVRSP